ncbi:MAG: DUF1538 domain-containing protein [bacterium]
MSVERGKSKDGTTVSERESSANTASRQITFGQRFEILAQYVKSKLLEQVKSVAVIISYLVLFQTLILGMEILDAWSIALGVVVIVVGLAFFMEGLVLGIMPLGEIIGLRLPEKSNLGTVLFVALVLGVGATFAEPAIGILKNAGLGVKPWEAPVLFLALNKYSHYLVWAVGLGVGVSVLLGMLRYLYGWSLKPFIYLLVTCLLAVTGWAYLDPKLVSMSGLSWDCGAVTTGPVTVPLILALGIGVCRVVGRESLENSGFGVVTLASLFPVVSVLVLGIGLAQVAPEPMSREDFFNHANRAKILPLFRDEDQLVRYVMENGSDKDQSLFWNDNREEMAAFIKSLCLDEGRMRRVFGEEIGAFHHWILRKASGQQRGWISEVKPELLNRSQEEISGQRGRIGQLIYKNILISSQAVIPLVGFLLLVLLLVLRERLPQSDEILLGIFLALVGMTLFNMGMETGLTRLGNQVGDRLPVSFKSISLPEKTVIIENFDEKNIQTALDEHGKEHKFFYWKTNGRIEAVTVDDSRIDAQRKTYTHVPVRGPILGKEKGWQGILLIILFALIMGYGATLAEPALNALGLAVEEITVGTFRKNTLIHAVALGVGMGMCLGVLKIVLGIPLFWLLAPLYLLALILTRCSTEEMVNIAWDSAGVTTGPVTVPLVLAMGLGLGTQVEVVEGFGILAMASVGPILTVLTVGLRLGRTDKIIVEKTLQ